MENEEVVVAGRRSRLAWGALTPTEKRRIARCVLGTIFGVLLFTGALRINEYIQFSVRMPGYIVLYWFPALMAGRAVAGYRGSGLIVSTVGGSFTGMFHPTVDSTTAGFALAGFAVEGVMFLADQNPSAWVCVVMGMAASVGKWIPKVAIILTAGSTPHHSRATLPSMLQSYLLFGGLAGLIYLVGRYAARKAQAQLAAQESGANPDSNS